MSEPEFRFKQFSVRHDRCAMKVGTDGVLLGAWARVGGLRLLDIGTGTGLLALMAAQRSPEARVTAVEIDPEAFAQAKENVGRSPFADRIEVLLQDIRSYEPPRPFETILCNPPFFSEDTLPPSASRALARHASLLSFGDLISVVSQRLLAPDGVFHVILPYGESNQFENEAFIRGLKTIRRCLVRTVERKPPRRVLLSLSPASSAFSVSSTSETLVLQAPDGSRSPEYARLTADFYLK